MRKFLTFDLSIYKKQYLYLLNTLEIVAILILSFFNYKVKYEFTVSPVFVTSYITLLSAFFVISYILTLLKSTYYGHSYIDLNEYLDKVLHNLKSDYFFITFKSLIYVITPFFYPIFAFVFFGRNGLDSSMLWTFFVLSVTVPASVVLSFLINEHTTKNQLKVYFIICLLVFIKQPFDFDAESYISYIPSGYCLVILYYNSLRKFLKR